MFFLGICGCLYNRLGIAPGQLTSISSLSSHCKPLKQILACLTMGRGNSVSFSDLQKMMPDLWVSSPLSFLNSMLRSIKIFFPQMQNLGESHQSMTHPLQWLMCDNLLIFTSYFLRQYHNSSASYNIITIPQSVAGTK